MDSYEQQAHVPPPRSHDELRELLPAYVADVALRTGLPEHAAEIAAHLGECGECRAEVDELIDLLREAAAGALAAAPSYPRPRLDFLRPAGAPWSVDELGRLVVRFSAALLAQIRPPALPTAARTMDRRGAQLYHYDHARFAAPDVAPQPASLSIAVFGVGPGPQAVEVVVRVGVAGRRATDLAGSEVTLSVGERVLRGNTDKFGYVTFPDIPADDLPRIQVTVAPTAGRSA